MHGRFLTKTPKVFGMRADNNIDVIAIRGEGTEWIFTE
jgi:hypothetical protein